MTQPHLSVLASEVMQHFSERHCRYVVDGTLGAGGHSELFLQNHPEIECLIGIDQDPTALAIARERLSPWKEKLLLVRGNFCDLAHHLQANNIEKVDAILLDLGVSSMQLDQAEKGFSFMRDGPLDMRMNPDAPLSAFEVINEYSENELGRIFRDYGEEKQWRAAARMIVQARGKRKNSDNVAAFRSFNALVGMEKIEGKQPDDPGFSGPQNICESRVGCFKRSASPDH